MMYFWKIVAALCTECQCKMALVALEFLMVPGDLYSIGLSLCNSYKFDLQKPFEYII